VISQELIGCSYLEEFKEITDPAAWVLRAPG